MKLYLSISFFLFSLINNAQKSDFNLMNFDKSDSIANSYQGFNLKNLPVLAHELTYSLDTQVEQFRAIHTWVCANIESDHTFGEITLRKRRKFKNDSISFSNWNNQALSKMFQKLLNDKKTICSGYAYLIKELATLVDIDCKIVDGYSRTTTRNVGEIDIPNHSWNAVKLDNKWYLVDATMASGYFNMAENKFVKNYNDGYFLASPELFLKRNYPLDSTWILSKNKTSLNQFVQSPIIYGNTFKHAIIPITPKTLITKAIVNEDITFKFKISDENIINRIRLIYSSGLRSGTIKLFQTNYNSGCIELKHRFAKKGSYDVHLLIDSDIVVSYTVKVEK